MRSCHVIEITTPKKFLLNGLWFGPVRPKRVIIWVHGLSSSAFSRLGIVDKLIDDDAAVMTFNNRGHDTVTRVSKINPRKKDGYERILAGGAHEKFTECVDDIRGAIDFARTHGAEEIFLAGHSTGCQKSVYFATRKGSEGLIKGVILLAPISDYAGALHFDKKERKLKRAEKEARALVKKGKADAIVPGWWMDAQRFLSLHTSQSAEEIFTYVDPGKKPSTYRALTAPTLVLFAGADEYSDRSAEEMAEWFSTHTRSMQYESKIFPKAMHSFKGAEEDVAKVMRGWILA